MSSNNNSNNNNNASINCTLPMINNVSIPNEIINQWNELLNVKLNELIDDSNNTSEQDNNDWKFYSEKDNVKIYSKTIPNDYNTKYKGVGKIKTKKNASEFIDWLLQNHLNLKKRKENSKELMECHLININQLDNLQNNTFYNNTIDTNTIDNNTVDNNNVNKKILVEWLKVETPSVFISNREFHVLTMFYKKSKDEGFMFGTSIPNNQDNSLKLPTDNNLVRAFVKLSGWYVYKDKKEEEEGLNAVFICHSDTGGYIPAWIVNTAMASQPMAIKTVSDELEREESLYNTSK
ncbi:hypothetical protein ABK040_016372 [Willaertia magna]